MPCIVTSLREGRVERFPFDVSYSTHGIFLPASMIKITGMIDKSYWVFPWSTDLPWLLYDIYGAYVHIASDDHDLTEIRMIQFFNQPPRSKLPGYEMNVIISRQVAEDQRSFRMSGIER